MSNKGIHSHFLSMHTDEETKTKLTGNDKSRKKNNVTIKQKAFNKRSIYDKNPNQCLECRSNLTYGQRRQHFCSSSCAAIYNNAEKDFTYIKTGPAKGTPSPQKLNPHTKIKFCVCEICTNVFTWNGISKGSKRCCKNDICKEKFKKKTRGGTGGYRKNSTRVNKSTYKGYQMDSGAELIFAQLLDKYNIPWIKNASTYYEFVYPNSKVGKYYPDFFLLSIGRWIEIKGKKYIREFDNIRQASANAILIMSDKLKDANYVFNLIMADEMGIEPT